MLKDWLGQQIQDGKAMAPNLLGVLPRFVEGLTGLSWGSIYTVLLLWTNGCLPYLTEDGRLRVVGPPHQARLVAFYEEVLNRPSVAEDMRKTLQAVSERFPTYQQLFAKAKGAS
ncbi:hypothetical protein [Geochorda subterranea]|uniref:Uncharacterized protein n=1 Tax=Geochorda subterranea TaxID=3109564 RepID=A0ABZ1BPQ1_9FIRM|nr:hypothetical protein [Limnochorda sp. LNt]WRP14588.1 hypothetical protein VLY81_14430 [Limnochorda sp. LNt]